MHVHSFNVKYIIYHVALVHVHIKHINSIVLQPKYHYRTEIFPIKNLPQSRFNFYHYCIHTLTALKKRYSTTSSTTLYLLFLKLIFNMENVY